MSCGGIRGFQVWYGRYLGAGYFLWLGGWKEEEREDETHAEAEAGDERKAAASPNRNHRDVKGPVFGADLCGSKSLSVAERKKKPSQYKRTGTRPSKKGHGPVVVMYPVSLLPKLKCVRGK
jgi:hypothetical protein